MLKQSINPFNKHGLFFLIFFLSGSVFALESDKKAELFLVGDNFKNLPEVKSGETQIKFWGHVSLEQGTLKISAQDAIVYKNKDGVSKIVLTGKPVKLEQIVDVDYGKINVQASNIDFMKQQDLLIMTGNVIVKSKIQGEMSGEKITMNLKTKEIQGVKSDNKRVKLIIKPTTD